MQEILRNIQMFPFDFYKKVYWNRFIYNYSNGTNAAQTV